MTKYESIKRDMKKAIIEHNHEATDKMRKNPHIYIKRYLPSDMDAIDNLSDKEIEDLLLTNKNQ
jgi:hypothetical protein